MLKLKPNYYMRWCIIRWLIRMVFNCIRKLSCIEHFFKLEPASAFWKVPRQLLLLQSPHFYDQGHIGLGAFSINRFEHTSQPFHSSFFSAPHICTGNVDVAEDRKMFVGNDFFRTDPMAGAVGNVFWEFFSARSTALQGLYRRASQGEAFCVIPHSLLLTMKHGYRCCTNSE